MKNLRLAIIVICCMQLVAASVTITVPDAVVSKATAICEALRVEMKARSMTMKECAEEFLRRGIREFARKQKADQGRLTAQQDTTSEMTTIDAQFPIALDIAFCGDNTTDAEFGEQCDDGNNMPGDGCSPICQTE